MQRLTDLAVVDISCLWKPTRGYRGARIAVVAIGVAYKVDAVPEEHPQWLQDGQGCTRQRCQSREITLLTCTISTLYSVFKLLFVVSLRFVDIFDALQMLRHSTRV